MIIPKSIKKILIIKPRGIGDIILSTIVLDDLKKQFPEAKIDYLVESFAKESLQNNPLVNNVLTFQKSDFILKTISLIRKEKYDLIIDLWSNPRTAQITFFSGVKFRVGYNYKGRKYAYNILGTSERGEIHSAIHNLELLKAIGIETTSKKIHYYLNDDEKNFALKFFEEQKLNNKLVIGVIPSGGWSSKRCPPEKLVEICKALFQKLHCKFLILWGPDDKSDADFIKKNLDKECIIAPETTIREMSALISKCSLVIANDSGPMHIAAALNVPVIGLFGPTDPTKHGPFSENSDFVIKNDLHCIICNKLECPYNKECFYQMDVNEIVNKCENLLEKNSKKS
jgi:lipopolysaccharide heptosyltransferase II